MTEPITTRDPEAIRAHKAKGGKVDVDPFASGAWEACIMIHSDGSNLAAHRLLPLEAEARYTYRPEGLSDTEWAERLAAHRTEHGEGSVEWRNEPLPPEPQPRTERVPLVDALADERKIPSADGDGWWHAVGVGRDDEGRLFLYATKATDDLIVEHAVTAGTDGCITVLADGEAPR